MNSVEKREYLNVYIILYSEFQAPEIFLTIPTDVLRNVQYM